MVVEKDVIETLITSEDFRTSEWIDIYDCALAKSLKRQFPNSDISCGGTFVEIDGVYFEIEGNDQEIQSRCGKVNPQPLNVKLINTSL